MIMSRNPSPRIEEVHDDQWNSDISPRQPGANGQIEPSINGLTGQAQIFAPMPQPAVFELLAKGYQTQDPASNMPTSAQISRDSFLRSSWDVGANEGMAQTQDLFEQLQNFNGSLNNLESGGGLDFINNNGAWESGSNEDWMASLGTSGTMYNQIT
jgi:hypothetical protein